MTKIKFRYNYRLFENYFLWLETGLFKKLLPNQIFYNPKYYTVQKLTDAKKTIGWFSTSIS